MTTKIVTEPTTEPITVAEVKAHARIEISDDDALIAALITAARQVAEHATNRAIAEQTREVILDEFPEAIELPGGATSVAFVKYYDATGALVTLSSTDYAVDSESAPAWIMPAFGKQWPETYAVANAVRVRYDCGMTEVPEAIKNWLKIRVATMYENRVEYATAKDAAAVKMPFVDCLLDPYRVVVV